MRFDTVFNDLLGRAVATRKVVVYGDGAPWRPVVHVKDLVRAFLAALEAPARGDPQRGVQQRRRPPEPPGRRAGPDRGRGGARAASSRCWAQPGADQRTYKADFSKWARTFPDCEFEWTPERGAAELREAFEAIDLTLEDFEDKRFTRLKWLSHLLDSGAVDGELRWTGVEAGR